MNNKRKKIIYILLVLVSIFNLCFLYKEKSIENLLLEENKVILSNRLYLG